MTHATEFTDAGKSTKNVTLLQKRLGWGIVGTGWVAQDFMVPALDSSPNAHLVAACDKDVGALAAFLQVAGASGNNTCSGHVDLDEFLALSDVEAVYVATPNASHREIVERCAAAGKHVLCEKPMAISVEDAKAIVRACRDAGVQYATAFDQRYHHAHQMLAGLVQAGIFGEVTQVRVHYACWLPSDWCSNNWRIDKAEAGGGAGIDLAPHGIDLVSMILHDEWRDLIALQQRQVQTYEVDDGTVLLGRLSRGTLVTLHVGYNCPESFPRRRLELIGTKAMAIATDTMGQTPGGRVQIIHADDGRVEDLSSVPENQISPFLGQVEAFTRSVLHREAFPHDPERDVKNLDLLLKALASDNP
ncbi:MAG: Gfo/Idh/MocA family protein [Gemmataceae bacterium]